MKWQRRARANAYRRYDKAPAPVSESWRWIGIRCCIAAQVPLRVSTFRDALADLAARWRVGSEADACGVLQADQVGDVSVRVHAGRLNGVPR